MEAEPHDRRHADAVAAYLLTGSEQVARDSGPDFWISDGFANKG